MEVHGVSELAVGNSWSGGGAVRTGSGDEESRGEMGEDLEEESCANCFVFRSREHAGLFLILLELGKGLWGLIIGLMNSGLLIVCGCLTG